MLPLSDDRRTWVLYVLLMGVLAAVTFGSLTTHGFSTHDEEYIQDGALSQGRFSHVFSSERIYPGRPTFNLYLWAVYGWFGDEPAPYHVGLVVLHCLTSILLAYVFRRFGGRLDQALLVGLLFLMMVAHFRVVHWISCTSYVLALIGVLVAALLFDSSLRRTGFERVLRVSGACAAAFFGVLAHPSAVAVGVLCFVISLVRQGEAEAGERRLQLLMRAVTASLPVAAASLGAVVLLIAAYPNAAQVGDAVHTVDVGSASRNLLWMWGRMVSTAFWLPSFLSIDRPEAWELFLGVLAAGGMTLFCLRTGGAWRIWGVWALLATLPYLNNSLTDKPFGPFRYLYLPSAGFAVAAAWCVWAAGRAAADRFGPRAGTVGMVAVAAVLVGTSYAANRNSEAVSLYHSGRTYLSTGRTDAGIEQIARAVEIDDRLIGWEAYQRLLGAEFGRGMPNNDRMRRALQRYPDIPQARAMQGVAAFMSDDSAAVERGIEDIRAAIASADSSVDIRSYVASSLNNLGVYFVDEGDPRAVRALEACVGIMPSYYLAHFNLGIAYEKDGRIEDAIRVFNGLRRANPNDMKAVSHVGRLLERAGRTQEAIAVYQEGIRENPGMVWIYTRMAETLNETGQRTDAARVFVQAGRMMLAAGYGKEAVVSFTNATRAEVNLPDAWLGLGMAQEKVGDSAGARTSYERLLELAPDHPTAKTRLDALIGAEMETTG